MYQKAMTHLSGLQAFEISANGARIKDSENITRGPGMLSFPPHRSVIKISILERFFMECGP